MADTLKKALKAKGAGNRYPTGGHQSMSKGMGGIVGANMSRPFAGTMLAQAVEADNGSYKIPGIAPGLNPAYGNIGVDATMVKDRIPRLTRRKK